MGITASETRDGLDNDCDGGCDEELLGVGDIVITEIMKDSQMAGDTQGEWFELHNPTAIDIRICADWYVEDRDGESFEVLDDVLVPAGGFAVFGRNDDTDSNGGVTVDFEYGGGMWLGNNGDELILVFEGTEIDVVEYDTTDFPDPSGASMQMDPTDYTADNANASVWCTATSAYGEGDFGTPGAENDACPP